jgi:hypothetical protein
MYDDSFVTRSLSRNSISQEASWRIYQGVGHLADGVTQSMLLLEHAFCNEAHDARSQRARPIIAARRLLYSGVSEARHLLPHMLDYAASVFEGSDGPSVDSPSVSASHHGAATSAF